MLSLSCDSSMSLWITHLLSYLPTDLCKIEQCLYKLVLYEHVEDMQNTRNLLLQWVRCSDGAAAQAADRGDLWGGGREQRNENNPGNEAVRPESAGISSYLDVLCQWDSFVLVTCCYSVTSQDCCCALKWSYFCANKSRSRWTQISQGEAQLSSVSV